VGLTKDRSDAGLIAAANSFISPDPTQPCGTGTQPSCFSGTIDPIARKLLTAKAPDGTLLIPTAVTDPTQLSSLEKQNAEAIIQGPPSHFVADQVNGNIDYIFSSADRLAAKYYFQRDPNSNPFASSQLLGFPQTMNAGSQVVSLDNTTILNPNLSWEQRFGFIRERAYAGSSQFLNPGTVGITLPGTNFFPQIAVGNMDSVTFTATNIGPANNFANAGIFQNGFDGATNLNWVHGKQTISAGFSWDYSQLNVINKDSSVARLNFADFLGFLQSQLCSSVNSCGSGASASELFSGTSNRYFRSRQVATSQNPLLAGGPNQQNYSYGWQVPGLVAENVQTIVSGFTTGNAALRVPYIGYDPNSDFNEAIGISHYNALQASVNKRISHGLLVTGSYTWSHALARRAKRIGAFL
jgi:hypothetical protein